MPHPPPERRATQAQFAAASLLAARHLARRDAENVLIVGTGRLAPYMARAHCHERKVTRLRVWGRNGVGAQTLAQMLRDEGLPAQAVDDLEQAVREADIVSCATTATAPVVHGAWLPAGCHLDLVGGFRRSMREADDAAVARSRIYVDTYAGALAEAADIVEPLERGVIEAPACWGNWPNSFAAMRRAASRRPTSRSSSRWAPRLRMGTGTLDKMYELPWVNAFQRNRNIPGLKEKRFLLAL